VGHLLFASSDEPPFVPPCLHPPFVQRNVQEERMHVVECPLREASIGGRVGNCSYVMVPTARVNLIYDLGENTRPFIWFHLVQCRYKLIDDLL
jgi:hypothetical protein